MQVVIMAGGLGTRLSPLTSERPKALLPLGGTTLVGALLDRLAVCGMTEAVICAGHMGELLPQALGTDRRGVPLRFSVEDEPLGTAGGLQLVAGLAPDFLVVNCDIVTVLDFGALFESHRASGAAATVAAGEWRERLRFGTVEADAEGRVLRLREKPEVRHTILLGAYALNAEAVAAAMPSAGGRIDMPELLDRMIAMDAPVRQFFSTAEWLDVGTVEDYRGAARAVSPLQDE
ncbi:nucleotidyltransferase family protein [Aquibium sp. ELW1220]|uniref:nucleotidyltransferase family protein n=1 Tax=Aquibium sp. ELW1220 TaxID=2976766 RepID=UPI0025B21AAD|nr:nucleotidyltransferase family protein [Aquibium sp. ELW1220]MDN2583421.1 nucleotidyltransferase family protein [Aquibium sp. ELW1220]